jgi:hypothetical protein
MTQALRGIGCVRELHRRGPHQRERPSNRYAGCDDCRDELRGHMRNLVQLAVFDAAATAVDPYARSVPHSAARRLSVSVAGQPRRSSLRSLS